MIKYLPILILIFSVSCQTEAFMKEHIAINIYPYENENVMLAAAMPEFTGEGVLTDYKRRFEYLLINVPEIHLPEKADKRNEIGSLYPDTLKIKELYLKEYLQDKELVSCMKETMAPIHNPDLVRNKTFSSNELMEVASKFFYCSKVEPDSTIEAHVCIGLNGVKEANWEKDYTLLEAFCYEAIFSDFDEENSPIWESFVSEKQQSTQLLRKNFTTLNQYLEDVKLDLFERMKQDEILKRELLVYYELNKTNLAFKLIN